MLAEAVKYLKGRYDTIDVFIELLKGEQTLWIAFNDEQEIKGCCTVRIADYPNARCCSLDFIAGTGVDEWLEDGFKIIGEYAKEFGCTRMEGTGRPGWAPRLKKMGWDAMAIRFDFKISDGEN